MRAARLTPGRGPGSAGRLTALHPRSCFARGRLRRSATPARNCRTCDRPLEAASTGRPPSYCSTGCRRSREYEIRRLSRRLEAHERLRDALELRTAELELTYRTLPLEHTTRVAGVDRLIERDRLRLRELLEGGSGADE